MGLIRILPPEIVNRIAAGEVVERPGSVVKELIENSIDAGATEILVELEEGGKKLVRVRDNGGGIRFDDFPLVFSSHATSKLEDAQIQANLLGVASLGFRGEALASVGAVAMVTVTSKTADAQHAWRYRPEGGDPVPAAGSQGTVVEVLNLFYNVPARRKFLRTGATELSHAVRQFTRLAMAHPGIRFELTHGSKRLFHLPAVDTLRERLLQVAGRELAEGLLDVHQPPVSKGRASLTGFVGDPRLHRRDTREQHFFVNGRWVRDRTLSHALHSAYQGFQIPGRQPVAYLFIDVPPAEVDVNVHPTKTEVRFQDSSAVYRLVQGAVRRALEGKGPVVELPAGGTPPALPGGEAAVPEGGAEKLQRDEALQRAVKEFLQRPPRTQPPFAAPPRVSTGAGGDERVSPPTSGALPVPPPGAPAEAFQVLRSYIVLEASDGIAIIDQHAYHEKIIFEEVFRALASGRLASQRLLMPEVVDVSAEHMPLVEEAARQLRPLGFELDAFGTSSVAVHAFPTLFDRETGPTDLPGIVRSVLDCLLEDSAQSGPEGEGGTEGGGELPAAVRDAVRRIASTVACKRAVKAGMPLRPDEIRALLERGELARDPRNCPHGRPTAVFLSRTDIERQFDRK